MKPAHGLDDYLNLIVLKDLCKVGDYQLLIRVAGEFAAVEDIFQLKLALHTFFDYMLVILSEQLGNAGADNAVAHDGNIHSESLPFFLSDPPSAARLRG